MILNMSNGGNAAQSIEFTLSSDVSYGSHLIINNVEVPGGIIRGFALFIPYVSLTNDVQIVFAYADSEQAETNDFTVIYYSTLVSTPRLTNSRTNHSSTDFGFTYNANNKTLDLYANVYNGFYKAGTYTLLVW